MAEVDIAKTLKREKGVEAGSDRYIFREFRPVSSADSRIRTDARVNRTLELYLFEGSGLVEPDQVQVQECAQTGRYIRIDARVVDE